MCDGSTSGGLGMLSACGGIWVLESTGDTPTIEGTPTSKVQITKEADVYSFAMRSRQDSYHLKDIIMLLKCEMLFLMVPNQNYRM